MVQKEQQILDMEEDAASTLEFFKENDEIVEVILKLPENVKEKAEKSYENYSQILSRYQEQPHLLDQHIPNLLILLLDHIRSPETNQMVSDESYKYIYQICKVRSFKVFTKFLPHELSDLDFALTELNKLETAADSDCWERRYILLVWMSILVLNPFDLAKLDVIGVGETKMAQMYKICKHHTRQNDPCSMVAAFFCARFLVRFDMKNVYLSKYIDWVCMEQENDDLAYGQMCAIAQALKFGKREDLEQYSVQLLSWITSSSCKDGNDFLKYKYYLKIVQRIGMVLLPPRKMAAWRYQRGTRSLAINLQDSGAAGTSFEEATSSNTDDLDDFPVPDETEDVIEELLQGLRSASSDCRWLSAKGIGRICNRLPKILGDEVVGSVIEILNPLEPHEAWHGACLALAELAKRGLLLPYRLPDIVPLLMQALVYDEMRSYMPVGLNIRDAACYMSWAFARAYDPKDLKPFVVNIASALLVVASFDREINCRRAASAAFQESVGRLGNFPHGIDILTAADFYSVGLRTNAYLNISDYIGQYEEYVVPLVDHLIDRKVNHWDIAIRELTAKALNVLTKHIPSYFVSNVFPTLLKNLTSIDVNSRHGSILGIGEIVMALNDLRKTVSTDYLSSELVDQVGSIVAGYHKREQFRGMSGELMRLSCLDFIKNCSQAKIPVNIETIGSWQKLIDMCVISKTEKVRESAIKAIPALADAYYIDEEFKELRQTLIEQYIKLSYNDLEECSRMGYVGAIGVFPKFMLTPNIDDVINVLVRHSKIPNQSDGENIITQKWSEARRESIKALSNVIKTIGFEDKYIASEAYVQRFFVCFLNCLNEYTLDNRGDIGAWVREASMNALAALLYTCPRHLLTSALVTETMQGLSKQAVEKIDRTRGMAGKVFSTIIYTVPEIPFIPHHMELKEIFPDDPSKVLWLFADQTFPLFCSMLKFEVYSKNILLGLTASIGQLTESLVKHSSLALLDFIKSYKQDASRLGTEIIQIFESHLLDDRITSPLLNFLDVVLSSGCFTQLLDDIECNFSDEIFRLVNVEIKGHKKLYKTVSSINVFCHLIQVERLCVRVLSKLTLFLGLTHVHVRKTTAIKLYEALVLHGDTTSVPEENMDEILEILSETDWGQPLTDVRPIRNRLCELLGIKPPVSSNTK